MFEILRKKLARFSKRAKAELEKLELEGDKAIESKESGAVESHRKPTVGKGRWQGVRKRAGKRKRELTGKDLLTVEQDLIDDGMRHEGFFGRKLSEKQLDRVLAELEMILIEADVALTVCDEIKKFIKSELLGVKIKRKLDVGDVIETALRRAITNVLSFKPIDFDKFIASHPKPVVLMFVGVNGTGKTTAIARIAYRLKQHGKSSVIAAADTFRAGAIEQLERHAERLGVRLIKHQAGSDPAAVAYDAIEHAKARMKDVVLIDTAGRMQTNVNLMDEMKKIKRISNPDMIIFVGDALAGNDAIEQARKFNDAVGIDTTILTKIDADAKGGAALSIAYAIGKPILFIGTGQRYEDLMPFNPDWMVDRLFSYDELT
jgi:fused signal recognition particle receptor